MLYSHYSAISKVTFCGACIINICTERHTVTFFYITHDLAACGASQKLASKCRPKSEYVELIRSKTHGLTVGRSSGWELIR